MKELWLKHDLLHRKLTLPCDLSSLSAPWHFVIAEKMPQSTDRHHPLYRYFEMVLKLHGDFTLETYADTGNPWDMESHFRIQQAFRSAMRGEGYFADGEQIEGICFQSQDNLHIIYRTNFWLLPNVENIQEAMSRSLPYIPITKTVLLSALHDFQEEYHPLAEETQKAIQAIQKLPASFPLSRITSRHEGESPILSARSNLGKSLNLYLQKNGYPFLLNANFRSSHPEQRPYDYGLESITDIHSFLYDKPRLRNHHKIGSKKVRCYYSGIRYAGADRKIPRASIVRAVVPEREDASNEILSLLDVNFIHSDNKLPVLPFPFKFLREYQQQFHIQHLDENEK